VIHQNNTIDDWLTNNRIGRLCITLDYNGNIVSQKLPRDWMSQKELKSYCDRFKINYDDYKTLDGTLTWSDLNSSKGYDIDDGLTKIYGLSRIYGFINNISEQHIKALKISEFEDAKFDLSKMYNNYEEFKKHGMWNRVGLNCTKILKRFVMIVYHTQKNGGGTNVCLIILS
jgi:hypothetical protein